MTRSTLLAITILLAATSLGGCTDLRRALGMEKAPPDEFTVVQNAPLTLPPDYGLRPPHSGGRPASPSPTEDARQTVFRAGGQQSASNGAESGLSAGELALLQHAGANQPDTRIRQQVDAETQQVADASQGFVDDLLFWHSAPTPGEPVDASSEAARLRQNEAEGHSVTSPAPQAERTQRTILQGMY